MIVVTGGAGFIGRHLTKKFLEEDIPIRVVDRVPEEQFLKLGLKRVEYSMSQEILAG